MHVILVKYEVDSNRLEILLTEASDGAQARREKISERMKILQDIVPGCNKVWILRSFYINNCQSCAA